MEFLSIYLDAFTLCICLVLLRCTLSAGKRGRADSRQILVAMLYVNIALTAVDIITCITDGKPGDGLVVVNGFFYFVYFLLLTTIPFFYSLFVTLQLSAGKKSLASLVKQCSIQLIPLLLLVLTNPLTNQLYFFGTDNKMRPGELIPLYCTLGNIMMLYLFVKILINFSRIKRQKLFLLIGITLIYFSATLLQLMNPGISIIPSAGTVAALLVFLRYQNQSLDTDYLTGIFNRMQADEHIAGKIRRSTAEKTFSGIMIDLDNFKEINDRFGHSVGDDALEMAAKLLKSSIHHNDFVARVGGDEFLIILNMDSLKDLKKVAERINRVFEKFNTAGSKNYQLSFSMGYDVYDFHKHMSKEQFLKHIDQMMYVNKKLRKETHAATLTPRAMQKST